MIEINGVNEWVMLTHWDLDAAGSVIAAKQFYDIKEYKAQGYGKVDKNIKLLIENHGNSDKGIVIGDLSLSKEQLQLLMDNFEVVHYYDHHIDSEQLIDMDDGEYHRVWFDIKMCATALIVKVNMSKNEHITREMFAMVKIIDAYDMWRTDTALFNQGKAYNMLFWQSGLFGFVKRFISGFSHLHDNEKTFITDSINSLRENIDIVLEHQTTQYEHMILCSLLEHQSDVINELSLKVNDIDVFFCIIKRNGMVSGSIRSKRDDIDVNALLGTLEQSNPLIMTAGGHNKAGGVTMTESATLHDIVKVAEDFNQLLDDNTSVI